jgi:hypothetical protein
MDQPPRTETTLAGAAQHSSDETRQVLPLNHPSRSGFRVAAATAGLVTGVWALVAVGPSHRVTAALLVAAVLAMLVSAPRGNVGAAASTGLGAVLLLLGLAQLAITRTSLNVLHASVLNVAGVLLLGLVVGACGLYEWETDDHGRMVRQLRRTVTRDVRA